MKSKLILLDIFSYSCMNCLRSLEFIKQINGEYKKFGFKIIIIHPHEWEFEKNKKNILSAFKKYKINFPLIIDKDNNLIKKFNIDFWPAQVLISNGNILYKHIGEGNYRKLENAIVKNLKIKTKNIFDNEPKNSRYPTVYCGKRKNDRTSKLYIDNKWAQNQEYIKSLKNKSALTILTKGIITNFVAESSTKKYIMIKIKLNDKFIKKIKICKPQLYNLIKLRSYKQKKLTIITPKNLCIYSFSFR